MMFGFDCSSKDERGNIGWSKIATMVSDSCCFEVCPTGLEKMTLSSPFSTTDSGERVALELLFFWHPEMHRIPPIQKNRTNMETDLGLI